MLVASSAWGAQATRFLHNDWETNDWLSLGIVLPAPAKHCKEKNDQPPCYRIKRAPLIIRGEVGRFRHKMLQWNLASGSIGLDWVGREHLRVGLGGLGAHWKLANPNHELGFLVQLISTFMGSKSWGTTNTNIHYRWNTPHYFWEVGADFSVFWLTNPLGNEKLWGDGIEGFPIFIYMSAGV